MTVQCSLRIWYIDPETGERGAPVFGIGGSKLVVIEKGEPRLDDEAYKKARTDAIGVAMKDLGMAADVYFAADASSKYASMPPAQEAGPVAALICQICHNCGQPIAAHGKATAQDIAERSASKFGRPLCVACGKDEAARIRAGGAQ